MKTYIVHILRHCGWYTTTAEGENFSEAAIAAVISTSKKYGLNLDEFKVRYEFEDGDYPRVYLYWEQYHNFAFGVRAKPGDFWWSEIVRQGESDDCEACGGTGTDHYTTFHQCWACGVMGQRGTSSGKRHPRGIN